MKTQSLTDLAFMAMRERGLIADFSQEALNEADNLIELKPQSYKDLRDKMWVSIDAEDSFDLDQLTYAEKNRLFVAIALPAMSVKKDSELDKRAFHNTTTVYTPTYIFPLLPDQLSKNLTSLSENEDRAAIIIEMEIALDGSFELCGVYPGLVRNKAKLSFKSVSSFLDKTMLIPKVDPLIHEQLTIQDELTRRIQKYRNRLGALVFVNVEVEPVIVNGVTVALEKRSYSRSQGLIQNAMIATNMLIAKYFEEKKIPLIQRVVRTPKRWDRIVKLAEEKGEKLPSKPDVKALQTFVAKWPEVSQLLIQLLGRGEYVLKMPNDENVGHFDLAAPHYVHFTAPNRRFPDLVMQRLLMSHLANEPLPYTQDELGHISKLCTSREEDAVKVERKLRKSAEAMFLQDKVGQDFEAVIVGASKKGTWVRLSNPPLEGKLVEGFQNLDIGDRIKVRLKDVSIEKGFIDFMKI